MSIVHVVTPLEDVLAGKYRVVGELGRGGIGRTYVADDLERGGQVALKQLWLWRRHEWKVLELFEREARVLARLRHRGIPRYVDFLQEETSDGPCFYLAQELARGTTLKARLSQGPPPTETFVRRVATELLDILEYLHDLRPPVIHRDIKPANLVWTTGDELALVDFGSVRDAEVESIGGSTIVGTFGFMAPEQFRGHAAPQTDLYGLGATCVYLLTGKTVAELPEKGGKCLLEATSISRDLAAWLGRLIERRPEDRFRSARQARRALNRPPKRDTHHRTRRPKGLLTRGFEVLGAIGVACAFAALPIAHLLKPAVQALPPQPVPVQASPVNPDVPRPTGRIRRIRDFVGHSGPVYSVGVDPEGRRLVTTSDEYGVRLWDIERGAALRTLPVATRRTDFDEVDGEPREYVGDAAFAPVGRRVIAAADSINVFDADTGGLLREDADRAADVTSIAISPDGWRLASTRLDRSLRISELATGREIARFQGPERCTRTAWSPNGQHVVAGCSNGVAYLLDAATAWKVGEFRRHEGRITAVRFSADGNSIVTASSDRTVRVWSTQSQRVVRVLRGHTAAVRAIAVSPDGQTLLSGDEEGTIRLWGLYSGAALDVFHDSSLAVMALASMPDGRGFVAGQDMGVVSLFTTREPSWRPPAVTENKASVFRVRVADAAPSDALVSEAQEQLDLGPAGSVARARELLLRALAANPTHALAHVELARCTYQAGRSREGEYDAASLARAQVSLARVLAGNPNLIEAHVAMAYVLFLRRDLQGAQVSADKALYLDPKGPRVALLLAFLAEGLERYDEEFAQARRVIETTDDRAFTAAAYGYLATVYEKRSEWDAVELALDSVVNLLDDPAARARYASFQLRRGNAGSAVLWARRAIGKSGDTATKKLLADALAADANALLSAGKSTEEVGRLLDEAQRTSKVSADALYARGRLEWTRGYYARARAAQKEALRIDPDHAMAKKALASMPW